MSARETPNGFQTIRDLYMSISYNGWLIHSIQLVPSPRLHAFNSINKHVSKLFKWNLITANKFKYLQII